MSVSRSSAGSWIWATVDTLLSVLCLSVILYPAIHYTNTFVGAPLSKSHVAFVVGALALGGAYPFVAGDLSLGDLGEYVFIFLLSAFGWGVGGMITILLADVTFSGDSITPQAVVWGLAYLTAYAIVFHSNVTLFTD